MVAFGNALGAAGTAAILLIGFVLQFAWGELPCPLCNLQRVAFALCGFGFLLNLRFGVKPWHYALTLLGALFGLAASGRQVLLHIVPGGGAYGSSILGLHFYSWALILFLSVNAGLALLMILSDEREERPSFTGLNRLAAYALIAMTFANALSTFVQCGPIECPDNPVSYWLFR